MGRHLARTIASGAACAASLVVVVLAERGPVVVGRTDEQGQCTIPHLPADVTTLRVVGEHKLHADVKLERLDAK